jgi:hypothetical protein
MFIDDLGTQHAESGNYYGYSYAASYSSLAQVLRASDL